MEMQWDEMHRGPNPLFLQSLNEVVPTDPQPVQFQLDDVEMPRVINIRPAHRPANLRQVSEALVISGGKATTSFPESIAFLKLFDADRRSNIGHVVFIPRSQNFVVPRPFCGVPLPGVLADPM